MNRLAIVLVVGSISALLGAACGGVGAADNLFGGGGNGFGGAGSTSVTGTGHTSGTVTTVTTSTSGTSGTTTTSSTASTTSATTTTTTTTSTTTGGFQPQVYCNGLPCQPGQVCCLNPTGPGDHCAQNGQCTGGYITITCNGPEDCLGNICCATFDFNTNTYQDISCQPSCDGQDNIVVCSETNPTVCPNGTSCQQSMALGTGYHICVN
jgi:hypothetical protein